MRSIFMLIFLFLFANSFAQTFNITGKVVDEKNDEPLIGVNITINELKIGTSTNEDGYFIFRALSPGIYTLTFSYIGHKTVNKKVALNENTELTVALREGTINLEEVLVTGNPFSLDPKELTQSVFSISNLEMEIKRSSNIATTLNYQPGVSLRSNGIATARPIIRGFSNNRVLILQNGLRMGDLSNTSDDHSVSSDGSLPEKIEVLRGPSSLLYGSNALGGVVNIISEEIPKYIPDGIDGDIFLSHSTVNDDLLGSSDIHWGVDRFSFHGNYFKRKSKNYVDGSGNEVDNSNQSSDGFQLGFSFHPVNTLAGISYSKYSTVYGIPYSSLIDENLIEDEGPINIKMKKDELRILVESSNLGPLFNSFSLKGGYQNYQHQEILKSTGEISTSFGLKSYSADLSFNHKPIFQNLKGIFGIWLMSQNYTVNGEEAFTPNADYFGIAAYFFEQFSLDKFNFQFGVRIENNIVKIPEAELSDTKFEAENKNYLALSGSIGVIYNLNNEISFFSNFANAFRAPTIEELSSYAIHGATATFDIGNRNLLNEKSFGIDAGFRLRKLHHLVELSLYYNILKNYIYRKPTSIFYNPDSPLPFNSSEGFPVFIYEQSNSTIYGFELKAQYEITRFISITTIMDYNRGFLTDSDNNLPLIPPLRFSVEPRYLNDNYWFGTNIKFIAPQNKVAEFENSTSGYMLIDIYGGIKITTGSNIHLITLKAMNILGKNYRDHLSSTKDFAYMPGRNIELGYKFLF